jgi:penicillin-binding protein-related factor A (putative recombinase)
MPLETTITASILKYLNTQVQDCVAEKTFGGMFGSKGKADVSGCWKGRAFRIEVKSPDHNNQPSNAQILNMRKWEKAGALCFVAYSLKDVKEVIK